MSLAEVESKFVDNAIYGGWTNADAQKARAIVGGLFAQADPKALRDLRI
jgi:hypothetical protein